MADFLYCLLFCPEKAILYLIPNIEPIKYEYCYATATFRYISTFTSWITIGVIAISRCIHVISPATNMKVFGKLQGKLVSFMTWIVSIIILLPIFTKVSF